MYKELEKYKTGNKLPAVMEINHQEVTIELDEYKADLGDLINDFIECKNIPWWARQEYHKHLIELYIKMLNKISISHGF